MRRRDMWVRGLPVIWPCRRSRMCPRSRSSVARSARAGPPKMGRNGGRRRCLSHGVWVFLEGRAGRLRDVSTQLIGEGRRLADLRGTPLTGILPGHDVDALAGEAIGYGLDRVIVVDDPILEIYRSRPFAEVMAQLIRRQKPEIILFGASKNGPDVGGRLHAILETGLAADCVKFDIDPEGNLDMIRPSFGGKSLAHILCKKHRPQMA